MLKRTKGYVLLALLVVTGLASQVSHTTLSSKERRFLVQHLKETKTDVVRSVKGLSQEQLHFKPAADSLSIKECMEQLALLEDSLWALATTALQQPVDQGQCNAITVNDAALLQEESKKVLAKKTVPARWSSATAALEHFKTQRQKTIKYVKTTTADVRSHVTQLSVGTLDAYQVVLLMSVHTASYTQHIETIKAHPAFPK
jgi:hypothetical protein